MIAAKVSTLTKLNFNASVATMVAMIATAQAPLSATPAQTTTSTKMANALPTVPNPSSRMKPPESAKEPIPPSATPPVPLVPSPLHIVSLAIPLPNSSQSMTHREALASQTHPNCAMVQCPAGSS